MRLSVCLPYRISLEPHLRSLPVFVHVAYVRCSVLLWHVDDRPHCLLAGRGCHKRRLNLALVFCVIVHFFSLVNVCFCCARFSFPIPSQEVGLGNVYKITYFVSSGRKTLTPSSLLVCQDCEPYKNGSTTRVGIRNHMLLLLVTTTTVLRPVFRDHPNEPVPEENFWTLWCKGRLTEADTPTIRLGATPSGLTNAHLHHPPIQVGCPSCQQCQSTEGN